MGRWSDIGPRAANAKEPTMIGPSGSVRILVATTRVDFCTCGGAFSSWQWPVRRRLPAERPRALRNKFESKIRGLSAAERCRIRQQNIRPVVEALEPWLRARLSLISQKSKLAEAIRHAISRWARQRALWRMGRSGSTPTWSSGRSGPRH
jgi:hypothetical protein